MRTFTPVSRAVATLISLCALVPGRTLLAAESTDSRVSETPSATQPPQPAADQTLDVEVNAARLDRARNGLQPDTGSSIYTFDAKAIDTLPAGQNTPLNQVLLQAPGVVQDSYGQLHVRGDHADLQYRINGVIIPEAISGFGQALDTRIIDQVSLLTGALPAQFGYRTAGIVDIRTKGADAGDGGEIGIYGGSHGTLDYDATLFGTQGALSYFFTGSLNQNNLGIEAPTSDGSPIHDFTRQANGFGYLSYLLDPLTRVNVMFGASTARFELPNTPGLTPAYSLNGRTTFDSSLLDENQHELNEFASVALQGTNGDAFDYQVALFTRYTRTQFNPDPIGDLMFNGVASQAYHNNVASGLQADFTERLTPAHTLRFGGYVEQEHATFRNSVSVFPADADGNQLSDIPMTIPGESGKTGHLYSLYVQDEWNPVPRLTINYGLRYDRMDEYVSASQLSPRLGLVYALTSSTKLHAGYARYFTPPAFELVNSGTINQFAGTTNQQEVTQNDPVKPERSHYFDIGIEQQFGSHLTVGLDAYYKKATDLLDEGQFGTALIFSPFNYAKGRVVGAELTANYHDEAFSAYLNLAYSHAQGTDINSAQFNFGADELTYIATHWVNLDHDQAWTGSAGGSYTWGRTTLTADTLFGSGLRAGFANTERLPFYAQVNLGVIEKFKEPYIGPFTARFVVLNVFDRVYELRDGTGIGVGAPQYGPRRAFYAGLSKSF